MIRVPLTACLGLVLTAAAPVAAEEFTFTKRIEISEEVGGTEALAFSPNGKLIAAAQDRNRLGIWDTATGELVGKIEGYKNKQIIDNSPIRTLVFSPDGRLLAGGKGSLDAGGYIFVWDVSDPSTIRQRALLKEHGAMVSGLAFTPDGKTLISASFDKQIRFWDVATGKTTHILKGHIKGIASLGLSEDGKVLVTNDYEEIKVWDLTTNEEKATWKGLSPHSLLLSRDGKTLAVLKIRGEITFWDVATGKPHPEFKEVVGSNPMALSPDNKLLIWGGHDGRYWGHTRVSDCRTGRQVASWTHRAGGDVRAVAVSPDGKLFASGDIAQIDIRAQRIILMELTSGKK